MPVFYILRLSLLLVCSYLDCQLRSFYVGSLLRIRASFRNIVSPLTAIGKHLKYGAETFLSFFNYIISYLDFPTDLGLFNLQIAFVTAVRVISSPILSICCLRCWFVLAYCCSIDSLWFRLRIRIPFRMRCSFGNFAFGGSSRGGRIIVNRAVRTIRAIRINSPNSDRKIECSSSVNAPFRCLVLPCGFSIWFILST